MKDANWIPNWRNPDEYPDSNELSRYEWMWEFLRRNPRYQEICDEQWSEYSKFTKTEDGVTINPAPKILYDEFQFGWGSDFPHYSHSSGGETTRSGRYGVSCPITFRKDSPMLWSPTEEIIDNIDLNTFFKREIQQDKVFVSADLTASIDSQLIIIGERLKKMQKERGLGTKRSQTTKFPLYIRLLDALSIGEKNSDIRDALFPEIEHSYPDSPRKDRYNYTKKTAIMLRDINYREIMINNYYNGGNEKPFRD
jgi:hypothetical protein